MRQTNTRVISEPQESYVFYYSHFEITGDSCNLVGSQQGDLFPNRTFFFAFFALLFEKGTLKQKTINQIIRLV